MNLKPMFVLPTGTEVDGVAPTLPYQFSATENTTDNDDKFRHIVDIVMSLGGSESALYRYPKEGEKVLVALEGEVSYLMGYLPENPKDRIFTGPKNMGPGAIPLLVRGDPSALEDTHKGILPEEMAGQFFRYKGPNDYPSEGASELELFKNKEKFSEIGFYNEQTLWKNYRDAAQRKADSSSGVNDSDRKAPEISTLKIKSTGDINQSAANHNQIKAKRFELLVNCDGGKASDKEANRDFGLGDRYGDDPNLYAGDAHIRAKNRIVIKAEKEIVLEVGRSMLVISDTGINLMVRKTRSKVFNTWDTRIGLDAPDGIAMYGKTLYVRSTLATEISDAYGASFKTQLGIVRIEGVDVRLATMLTKNYLARVILNGVDIGINVSTMAAGIAAGATADYSNASSSGIPNTLVGFSGLLATISNAMTRMVGPNLGGAFTSSKLGGKGGYDIKDTPSILLMITTFVWLGTMIVREVAEFFIPEKILREHSVARDSVYMAAAVVEYGYNLATASVLVNALLKGFLHESVIWLEGKSRIHVDALTYTNNSVMKTELNSVLAAFAPDKTLKETIKEGWKKFVEKTSSWSFKKAALISVGIGLGIDAAAALAAGAGVGLGAAYIFGPLPVDQELEEYLRSL